MLNAVRETPIQFDENQRADFLAKHGWDIISTVGQDSSVRRYFRLRGIGAKSDQSAILMETVPDNSPHATPGHSVSSFIEISKWLNSIGANAPDIYEVDEQNGLLILEDFGATCFKYASLSGQDPAQLYTIAAQTLDHIAAQNCPLDLPQYYESHVHKRHRRVVDWYMPLARQSKNEDGLVEAYKNIWADIENSLPPCPQGFVHVDYHAENLMWIAQEQGIKRCGILDFQGAMIGPAPYDLANLLEDARTDVPLDLKESILAKHDETFRAWFRVLATQFHCRVIGQFLKIAIADNNPQYLPYIPRLEKYLREALNDPLLKPLKTFFDEHGVYFDKMDAEDLQNLKTLIRPDAF
ncbi:MAG: phosphotransferase [Alphaproteobacteria bacterium]|nr:phosphotransferase [Alphaproteobacteria bacterium]